MHVARAAPGLRRAIDDAVASRPFNPPHHQAGGPGQPRLHRRGLLERRPPTTTRTTKPATTCCNAPLRRRGARLGRRRGGDQNRFQVGDMLEIITPGQPPGAAGEMFNLDGEPVQVARAAGARAHTARRTCGGCPDRSPAAGLNLPCSYLKFKCFTSGRTAI